VLSAHERAALLVHERRPAPEPVHDDLRGRYGPASGAQLLDAVATGDVTVVYSSRDTEHNNAVALRDRVVARLEATASR